jgi:TRAP-type C4-dicarboxylate transport system substrate-binding protein
MVRESTEKLKAAGVQFVDVDKKAFYEATRPVRDKYGSKWTALVKRIEETR